MTLMISILESLVNTNPIILVNSSKFVILYYEEVVYLFSRLSSLGLTGIKPYIVSVEVDLRRAMPGFDIVGLPDSAVKESRDRVKSALPNLGYKLPDSKIVANLAPADTRKAGSVYDLPILLALLSASGLESFDFEDTAVIGEISLSGEIRGVTGVLPMALDAGRLGLKRLIVPMQNATEASVADDIEILAASHVRDVIGYFRGENLLTKASGVTAQAHSAEYFPDIADVKGQSEAKRAMEIAAAGNHNLLFIGSPGTGKSMLAKRLPSILPAMTKPESIETTKIYSVSGLLPNGTSLLTARPFRSPHHTVSSAAITGGGSDPKPGELSLAHNGVLFLDELPEFQKTALEVLRQPLEDGVVNISRVRGRLSFPSKVMLVAAMNPCPCGYYGHPTKNCTCSQAAIQKYLGRVSGPLLDRIDIHVEVLPVEYEQISSKARAESSKDVQKRVEAARNIQLERYKSSGITSNAALTPAMLGEACKMEPAAEKLLKSAFDRLGLSGRGYDRVLKVARTIADLDGSDIIAATHISQAVQLRNLDRKYWAG